MALTKDPEPLDTAAQDDNASQTILEESKPDEDVGEEIVDDPNVLAEVTLPSRICQLQLFTMTFFLTNGHTDQRWSLDNAAQQLQQPTFPMLVKKFLYQQLYPDSEISFADAAQNSY